MLDTIFRLGLRYHLSAAFLRSASVHVVLQLTDDCLDVQDRCRNDKPTGYPGLLNCFPLGIVFLLHCVSPYGGLRSRNNVQRWSMHQKTCMCCVAMPRRTIEHPYLGHSVSLMR